MTKPDEAMMRAAVKLRAGGGSWKDCADLTGLPLCRMRSRVLEFARYLSADIKGRLTEDIRAEYNARHAALEPAIRAGSKTALAAARRLDAFMIRNFLP